MKNYTVGEKLFIRYFGSWNWFYMPVIVSKVMPAGTMDVKIGSTLEDNESEPKRFRANGKIQKSKARYEQDYEIDTMPYEERLAEIAPKERAKIAASAVSAVTPEGRATAEWGKERLSAEVTRLQELLTAARQAVDEI